MAIKGVDPQCYILALFVRDDGERFLLGSGAFTFKNKQMHFMANTIQNDAVEVQGADGYLLAGQVRRPGSQNFDGYVGGETATKEQVETNRRAFFSFFRKNYFYKVVYVFPNGTAIQRKRGFLVDDPTVKELYQVDPEYHVALNFEDVNYYSYSENDEGEEIYAKDAIIKLTAGAASGGLVWDAYGVEWDPITWSGSANASGSEFVILNNAGARAPLIDTSYLGNTTQITYSGKNLFDFDNGRTLWRDPSYMSYVNDSNSCSMTATGTSGAQFARAEFGPLNPTKTYTLSGKAKKLVGGSDGSPILQVYYYYSDDGVNYTYGSPAIYKNSTPTVGTEYSFNGSISGHAYYRLYFYNNAGTPVTIGESSTYYDIQFEEGSATSYEPYVGGIPSPNPDYPQDVNVVTGEQAVWVHGKNMFDLDSLVATNITVASGVATGTATAFYNAWKNGITLPPFTGQLSLSAKAYTDGNSSTSNVAGLKIVIAYTDGTKVAGITWNNSDTSAVSKTYTTDANKTVSYVAITYQNTGSNIWHLSNFQIEKGSATTYEPYQGATYTIDLGSTELCKIGTYQDKIYKSGDDWYVHKEIGKVVYDGDAGEGWTARILSGTTRYFYITIDNPLIVPSSGDIYPIFSNYYTRNTNGNLYNGSVDYGIAIGSSDGLRIRNKDISSAADFKTWLTTHTTNVYYPLATPTDTKITDNTLIGQLEAVLAMKLLLGTNNVEVSATGTNLTAILDVDYFTTWAKGGAVWEEGGPTGPTVLDVESIDNVYPVWEVTGPATNPQLSVLTTNTTIQYNGSVTSTQTLVIDMFNKTATLNGASVIGNVSGDWVDFKPGENKVTYTTDNADAPDSQIKWQEIVG